MRGNEYAKVNTLKEMKSIIKRDDKECILSDINHIINDIIQNQKYDAFVNIGYEYETVVSKSGYMEAIEELRELPEYETDLVNINGIEYFAIKVLPIYASDEKEF